jgi:hypothetical protein
VCLQRVAHARLWNALWNSGARGAVVDPAKSTPTLRRSATGPLGRTLGDLLDKLGRQLQQGKVQKLTAARDKTNAIPHHRRDGEQRILYRTDELDAWVERVYEYEGPPSLRAVET